MYFVIIEGYIRPLTLTKYGKTLDRHSNKPYMFLILISVINKL